MKEAGYDHWNPPNMGGNNLSGFSALAGGTFNYGNFLGYGQYVMYWSSSNFDWYGIPYTWARQLKWDYGSINRDHVNMEYIRHKSLRCLKNDATVNNPPSVPVNSAPLNGAADITLDTDLVWTCSDPEGDALTYDVYFGTAVDPPLVSSEQSGTTFDPGTMSFNITYYWKIVSTDIYSLSTTSDIWSFTTEDGDNAHALPANPQPHHVATDISIDTTIAW